MKLFSRRFLRGMQRVAPIALFALSTSVAFASSSEPEQADPADLDYQGDASQFYGGFQPGTGYGGFGGGNCSATKTPVVFLHGNGDNAINWDYPAAGPYASDRSVYEEFRAQGYNRCELFGVTYLSSSQQDSPQNVYHSSSQYRIIGDFIKAVQSYTGHSQVDIVAHSLGSSMALAALKHQNLWGGVRNFVNIAGGIRGLNSCLYMGYSNPWAPTCGSENIYTIYTFGFYPDNGSWSGAYGKNSWTGGSSSTYSMRRAPERHPSVNFYTIHAGLYDQVHCSTTIGMNSCTSTPQFNSYSNVKAQLDVGAGTKAGSYNYDFSYNMNGGDVDGVGHFRAKNNTGVIIHRMLNSGCSGSDCASGYSGPVN